jgi:phosphoribosylamine---glycine ligase
MRVLIVGSGAREHALAWKLAGESAVSALVCTPGNVGIEAIARCVPVDITDPQQILALAEHERIDLTVVGPELPLTRGVADLFARDSRPIVGPSREAAALESSKAFAKDFMARHAIPTARYRVCDTVTDALTALARAELGYPVVVKADGLAAGKGVTVAPDRATAERAVREAMEAHRFGEAGARIVLEECLTGREASFFVLTDGERTAPLGSAEDHKRALENDRGPNTGGMGAFAPSPLIDAAMQERIMGLIVRPVVDAMRHEGHPYRGFLYVGLMLTDRGPAVIEFNARLGDPERQVVMPALDEQLSPRLFAAATGQLTDAPLRMRTDRHVGVVLASGGYPDRFETGKTIEGLEQAAAMEDVVIFHAGTARREGRIVTAGGRVLTVAARGATYGAAIDRAYEAVSRISFEGVHIRHDIGKRATQC